MTSAATAEEVVHFVGQCGGAIRDVNLPPVGFLVPVAFCSPEGAENQLVTAHYRGQKCFRVYPMREKDYTGRAWRIMLIRVGGNCWI